MNHNENYKNNLSLMSEYKIQVGLLKQMLANEVSFLVEKQRPASLCVARAMLGTSSAYARQIHSKGWIAGSQYKRQGIEDWLQRNFDQDKLSSLIHSCANQNVSVHQEEILLFLVHNTPKTIVHPPLKDIFDN